MTACAAVLWCLIPWASHADGQRVAGRVRLPDSTPAVQVAMSIVDSAGRALSRATTNEGGRYAIDWLPTAKRLTIARIGVRPVSLALPAGAPHDTAIDIMMEAAVVPSLDTVTSRSDKPQYFSPLLQEFEARRAGSAGYFVSDFELRHYDNSSLATVVPAKIPGIRLIWYRSQTFAASTRGSNKRRADPNDPRSPIGCWVSVAIDGMVVYKGAPFVPPDLAHMQVNEYAGVEFYEGSSTMPPKFAGQNAACGFLLLWTREK